MSQHTACGAHRLAALLVEAPVGLLERRLQVGLQVLRRRLLRQRRQELVEACQGTAPAAAAGACRRGPLRLLRRREVRR
jgi:hypothetical protein